MFAHKGFDQKRFTQSEQKTPAKGGGKQPGSSAPVQTKSWYIPDGSPANDTGGAGPIVQCRRQIAGTDFVQASVGKNGKRNVMVKETEPAAIYLNSQVPPLPEFSKLGIVGRGSIGDPDGQALTYSRYVQGRIPRVELKTAGKPPETKEQPVRSPNEEKIARYRLMKQYEILEDVNACASQLLSQLNLLIDLKAGKAPVGDKRLQQSVSGIHSAISGLNGVLSIYKGREENQRVSMLALGTGILHTIYAIIEIAHRILPKQVVSRVMSNMLTLDGTVETVEESVVEWVISERTPLDYKMILEMLQGELELRFSQVDRELERASLKPYLPTACDLSAQARSNLLFGHKDSWEIAGIKEHGEVSDFNDIIGWNHHLATELKVGHLTDDSLFIEDAVGSSLSGDEAANAHWFAHLYGPPETDGTGQGAKGVDAITPGCLFNQLSLETRAAFFKSVGLDKGAKWRLRYTRSIGTSRLTRFGTLTVSVTPSYQYEYGFENAAGQVLTPAMADFLRATADAVADDLLIQDFSQRQYRRVKEDDDSQRPEGIIDEMEKKMMPETRSKTFMDQYEAHFYALEDVALLPPHK